MRRRNQNIPLPPTSRRHAARTTVAPGSGTSNSSQVNGENSAL